MDGAITYVTHSKYYSPAFNAAIFDGPIRIYFAQHQEAQALKLYFNLQERYGDVRREVRGRFREQGRNVFVMLYPSDELFEMSFDPKISLIGNERLGADYVLGVRGPLADEALENVCQEMDQIVRSVEASSSGESGICSML